VLFFGHGKGKGEDDEGANKCIFLKMENIGEEAPPP